MEAQISDSLMLVADLSKRERKRTIEALSTAARKSCAKSVVMGVRGLGESCAGLEVGPAVWLGRGVV